ncbi:hypothetical protein GJ496_007549 [Pomphorhynchus laevis]|nr:hypothetical protein GJ496_007549 [Pomphorhynchus laevis]
MFPLFHICHCILTIEGLRSDLVQHQQPGKECFYRQHPLSCWFSSILSCFAGSMIANALLGEGILNDLKNNTSVIIICVIWYLIFYFPFDLFHKFCQIKVVKLILSILKEIQRVRKINDGIIHAMHTFPNGFFLVIFVGTAKGSGSQLLSFLCRFICGIWIPNNHEFVQPSLTTKLCLIISTIFFLQRKQVLQIDKYIMSVGILVVLICLKILTIYNLTESIQALDKMFTNIIFGDWSNAVVKAKRKAFIHENTEQRLTLERVRSMDDKAEMGDYRLEKSKKRD